MRDLEVVGLGNPFDQDDAGKRQRGVREIGAERRDRDAHRRRDEAAGRRGTHPPKR